MINPALEKLKNLKSAHKFFIGIDSDGCAFDSMEIKHKECFIPAFIKHCNLQPIAKYAREAAEFTNLYSKNRGSNRFLAYLQALELLENRSEVKDRKFKIQGIDSWIKFIKSGNSIDNPGLQKWIEENPTDEYLKKIMSWSKEVNQVVKELVHNVPPFPLVADSLSKAKQHADILVVSSTPEEALHREWQDANLSQYISIIAGQETGTKKDVLKAATNSKYQNNKVLMIGDAPGDLQAAKANQALFYPINPGYESESWEKFYHEALQMFLEEKYSGAYEEKLIGEFEKLLPEKPNWKF